MVNIKVAVRIRPLSEREIIRKEEIVVRKESKSVLVTDPKIPERQDGDSRQRTRRFSVDFCYDPQDPESCSQEAVYKEIGAEVLDSMCEGYNACVLAYGHSASGKTYTIMGLQDDPGLTPRLCEGLFERLESRACEDKIRVEVVASFLEIYNEKVKDLLGSEETGGRFSLRVREHPRLGPYVQGLSEHLVADRKHLLALLTSGNRKRSTAATENNTHSSRSHAVFTIHLKQSDGENCETEKWSKVHLVDLAGSLQEVSKQKTQADERAKSAQSKARLKEGANINKSLVTLGNVISALAESYEASATWKEHTKTWQPFVPYRDSVLTWLLKDTLGGNSHTIMIATISPGSGCLSETVNTLRYAKRTKRIVNQAVVNEDPKIRTIRELRKEIARLKGLLLSFQSIPEEGYNNREIWERWTAQDAPSSEEEELGKIKKNKPNEKRENILILLGSSSAEYDHSNSTDSARACAFKISDEKESVVNGLVNDNFSHESQIFSDSLESFSPVFPKSINSCDADVGSGRLAVAEDASDAPIISNLMPEFGSCDNFKRKDFPGMLHRSRPDLIKGISARFKEGLPATSSHSCTDVSTLSQSTSENSLNSSGSVDVQSMESRPMQDVRSRSLTPPEAKGERQQENFRETEGGVKKKDPRSEIVEAVTTRLYVTKNKPEHRVKVRGKKENHTEVEDLKVCKRARMKLFDLSRKLALTKRITKTVDRDTQTERIIGTIRVKEKSVETDLSGGSDCDAVVTPGDGKRCVIMNQVFFPRETNYVVECGQLMRIEGPRRPGRHESATQTSPENKPYKNATTSPIKITPPDEECFSDDSLDLECESKKQIQTLSLQDLNPEESTFKLGRETLKCFSCGFVQPFGGENQTVKTLESLPQSGFVDDAVTSRKFASRKEENMSSDSSLTSAEGTDAVSSSEASSEDFIFYDNSKEVPKGMKDRELYTITENSEQSDHSDAFSPVQNQNYSLEMDGKVTKWAEHPKNAMKVNDTFHDVTSKQQEAKNNFPTALETVHKSHNQVPRENATKKLNFEDSIKGSKNLDTTAKKINWADCQSNSQNQYLNLNILNSSKTPLFSIDTHLFAKDWQEKDHSADAMFTSADSVTLVFMGPAKPKTSVLMEIIRRSFGSNEIHRKKSRGVQCDGNLVRSVSVDTAMIALSRIVKNQEQSSNIAKTTSLGALDPDETNVTLQREKTISNRENNSDEYLKRRKQKSALKCSVGINTMPQEQSRQEIPGKKKQEDVEKPKKSVSWSGETKYEEPKPVEKNNWEMPLHDVETNSNEESIFSERKVRFSNSDIFESQTTEHTESLTIFLKEAIQLLKKINSCSSKIVSNPQEQELETDTHRNREENEKGPFKRLRQWGSLPRSKTENCLKGDGGKPKADFDDESNYYNSTWPRRRATTGKPPTGLKPKFLRSPRSDSPHSSGLSDGARSCRTWTSKFENCRTSALEETHSRLPSYRPAYENALNCDSLLELEANLENSCRRLELAVERDEIRQKVLESKKTMHEWIWGGSSCSESECRRRARDVIKRRKAGRCTGECTCSASVRDPCKHFVTKGCQSSFELDTFGPGSKHCRQFCMFCRKKDAEVYYSALNLNSECLSGFCRLNYYGYCPCSSVRLSRVASSPRAYMQHLLTLRRRIVGKTKGKQIESGFPRCGVGDWQGFPWLSPS